MRECSIVGPTGLGDHVLISGAVTYYTGLYDIVHIFCHENIHESVKAFYKFNKKVKVVPLRENSNTRNGGVNLMTIPVVGNYHSMLGGLPPMPFDSTISFAENYYRNLGVDYMARWDLCPINTAIEPYLGQDNPDWHPYAFVHDDHDRGFFINEDLIEIPIYRPSGFNNILQYASRLMYADEIHCMDSCFQHIAESIQVFGKLFFHEYAKPGGVRKVKGEPFCPTRKVWKVYAQDSRYELDIPLNSDITLSIFADSILVATKTLSRDYFELDWMFFLKNVKRIDFENLVKERVSIDLMTVTINGVEVRTVPLIKKLVNLSNTTIAFYREDITI